MIIQGITKGDTIYFRFEVAENITDWKIRFELYSDCGCGGSIQLANEAAGGSDDQITIDDVVAGVFTVKVPKADTTDFGEKASLELEIEDNHADIFTLLNGHDTKVILKCQKIKWETPS